MFRTQQEETDITSLAAAGSCMKLEPGSLVAETFILGVVKKMLA